MKKLTKTQKIIIMTTTLLLLIFAITYMMISDINFVLFKTLSMASISTKKGELAAVVEDYSTKSTTYKGKKDELRKAQTSFQSEKATYDNISDDTIAVIQEATKNEKYFIEYLWISLGNYAKENELALSIISAGDGAEKTSTGTDTTTGKTTTTTPTTTKPESTTPTATNPETNSGAVPEGTIKIVVKGTYADVADFVFEVENDKELKFKLDNISMVPSGDKAISATFNVINLNLLK